jgi:NO-binding membrane sensor protein with MHYT domain
VAVVASYAALELGVAVTSSPRRTAWVWFACGSIAMGLGFWSMHFIGMPAFHLPIPVAYDVPLTLLSLVPAILSSALVLVLVRRGHLKGWRLVIGAVLLGGGIAAMHCSGMAAVQTGRASAMTLRWWPPSRSRSSTRASTIRTHAW